MNKKLNPGIEKDKASEVSDQSFDSMHAVSTKISGGAPSPRNVITHVLHSFVKFRLLRPITGHKYLTLQDPNTTNDVLVTSPI